MKKEEEVPPPSEVVETNPDDVTEKESAIATEGEVVRCAKSKRDSGHVMVHRWACDGAVGGHVMVQ